MDLMGHHVPVHFLCHNDCSDDGFDNDVHSVNRFHACQIVRAVCMHSEQ
jgi:hypothetical protein